MTEDVTRSSAEDVSYGVQSTPATPARPRRGCLSKQRTWVLVGLISTGIVMAAALLASVYAAGMWLTILTEAEQAKSLGVDVPLSPLSQTASPPGGRPGDVELIGVTTAAEPAMGTSTNDEPQPQPLLTAAVVPAAPSSGRPGDDELIHITMAAEPAMGTSTNSEPQPQPLSAAAAASAFPSSGRPCDDELGHVTAAGDPVVDTATTGDLCSQSSSTAAATPAPEPCDGVPQGSLSPPTLPQDWSLPSNFCQATTRPRPTPAPLAVTGPSQRVPIVVTGGRPTSLRPSPTPPPVAGPARHVPLVVPQQPSPAQLPAGGRPQVAPPVISDRGPAAPPPPRKPCSSGLTPGCIPDRPFVVRDDGRLQPKTSNAASSLVPCFAAASVAIVYQLVAPE